MSTHWLIGIDEVGRGPLAGPVCIGVFAIPEHEVKKTLACVNDSKKLSVTQRNDICIYLKNISCARYAVTCTSARLIDVHGITKAIHIALERGLRNIHISPYACTVLLDGGLQAPSKYHNQKTIIKGDQKEKVIGAASILAKVTRDKKMCSFAKTYPKYSFEAHKGYGTQKHIIAIQKNALTPIHRKSFCRNYFKS